MAQAKANKATQKAKRRRAVNLTLFTLALALVLFITACFAGPGFLEQTPGRGTPGLHTPGFSYAPTDPTSSFTATFTPLPTFATLAPKPSGTAAAPTHTPLPTPTPLPTAAPDENRLVKYTTHTTYTRMQQEIRALAAAYPEIFTLSSIGTSVQGRDLTLLTMGNGAKTALLFAGLHAREHITTTFLLRMAEEYAMAYAGSGLYEGYDIRRLLSEYTFYLVPSINPDGMEICGGNAIPGGAFDWSEESYKANANGVDLNNNFPAQWDGIDNGVYSPAAAGFKGYSPASEPETQAIMELCASQPFEWAISLHVRWNAVFWSDALSPETDALSLPYANALHEVCGFSLRPTTVDPSAYGGGFENWFRKTYLLPGFCVELIPSGYTLTPSGDGNHSRFDKLVIWQKTRLLLAVMGSLG